jgi:hypothetical protein
MNPRSLTLNVIPFVFIMILVILAAGGESIVPTQLAAARSTDINSTAASLGNPFFVEKGRNRTKSIKR